MKTNRKTGESGNAFLIVMLGIALFAALAFTVSRSMRSDNTSRLSQREAVLAAADILLVPLGASFLEFDSTGRFFDMLHSTFSSIEEGENMAARALGREGLQFEWDAVRAVITRYDGAQQAELAALIQAYLGQTLSPHRQDFTALIGQAGESVNGIYEADYRDFNRETYARGRQTFDSTYAAFKRLLIGAWHRDAKAADAEAASG